MDIIKGHPTLTASSFIESVVAMLIMVSVVSVCFVIYGNVLESRQPHKRLAVKAQLLEFVHDCKLRQEFIDQTIEKDGYVINSSILPAKWRNVYEWSVTIASTSLRSEIKHKELIYLPNE